MIFAPSIHASSAKRIVVRKDFPSEHTATITFLADGGVELFIVMVDLRHIDFATSAILSQLEERKAEAA